MTTGHDEIRAFAECRVTTEDAKRLNGLAIVFHSLSVDLGGFREQIHPDAVDRTFAEATDVRALIDHEPSKVLGRTRAGTLTLRKEAQGLRAIIEPDLSISYAADIMRSVARGDVSGMSFRFRVMPNGDEWTGDAKNTLRTIHDMKIAEVSVVTFPAYEATNVNVALRSLSAFRQSQRGEKWYATKIRVLR